MNLVLISSRKAQGEMFLFRHAIKFKDETECVYGFELF